MLKLNLEREYKAAIYLRLSKDDGDFSVSGEKLESDSISNQRLLIKNFLKKHPEIVSTKEFCDDGYTGTNFDRPHFQEMMTAISSGELDCIVVKDLSRFGREYIEVGKYIEKIFPRLGIRFIAINDSYDNALPNSAANEIVLPFKNLINDSYCRDISIKVRSNLDAKRRNGEFVGSRVIYGYLRSPEDKNKLVVDVNVASVVQDIFRWKTEGLSPAQIAEKLNSNGVLSPIEYKRSCGSKQRTCFQTKKQAVWSAVAIYRILKNEMYTGTLIQGKTTTPNYKVKKTILKDETDWVRTTEAHEAIITPAQFDLVQKLMRDDTRSPVGADGVHPFSGKVFCADCGSAMVRKVSRCGDHEYAYFICGGYKNDKSTCSSHSIREDLITETVLAVIQAQIAFALDMDKAMSRVKGLSWENREIEKIDAKIDFQNEVIENNRHLKVSLYEDYHNSFGNDTYFSCTSSAYHEESQCDGIRFSKTDIENVIFASLKAQVSLLSVSSAKASEKLVSECDSLRQRLRQLQSEIEGCDREKFNRYEDYHAGVISADEYIAQKAKLSNKQTALKDDLAKLQLRYDQCLSEEENSQNERKTAKKLRLLSDAELRGNMYAAIERVTVFANDDISITWKFDEMFAQMKSAAGIGS